LSSFAVSPDGRWIVYERGREFYYETEKDRPDLWLLKTDGTGERLLLHNGATPAWH
jgi:hypothetical protein